MSGTGIGCATRCPVLRQLMVLGDPKALLKKFYQDLIDDKVGSYRTSRMGGLCCYRISRGGGIVLLDIAYGGVR
eukprot:994071-Rhodomonas_salina.3